MTRPNHVFVWMIPFLGLVGLAAMLLHAPLVDAFKSNPVFNAIILCVFLIGIMINFRQVDMLSREVSWVNHFRGKRHRLWSGKPAQPKLLAPLAKMLGKHEAEFFSLSLTSLRSLLDSVHLRLDESRDVSRYMVGLLVFLGLLGTFWGLLITVSAVGHMIGGLSESGADRSAMFGALMSGLHEPLSGMGTAFSSSLFGLAGSLVLGFLDLQAGHAQNRFFNELEDWLSDVTRFTSGGIAGTEREPGEPAYIHAMLEQTAESLDRLQRSVARDEAQRALVGDQIQSLGRELAAFAEYARNNQQLLSSLARGQTELGPVLERFAEGRNASDTAMGEHMRSLDLNIRRLVSEMPAGREQLADEIRDEIRIIGRVLAAQANSHALAKKQKLKD